MKEVRILHTQQLPLVQGGFVEGERNNNVGGAPCSPISAGHMFLCKGNFHLSKSLPLLDQKEEKTGVHSSPETP